MKVKWKLFKMLFKMCSFALAKTALAETFSGF